MMHDPDRRSALQEARITLSFGPYGYLSTAVMGFVVGSLVFVAIAISSNMPNTPEQLRLYSVCAVAGILLSVGITLVINYLVGSEIREGFELQNMVFAGDELPPPFPRPDVPGIVLQKRHHSDAARARHVSELVS
jgi:hypothetical protein